MAAIARTDDRVAKSPTKLQLFNAPLTNTKTANAAQLIQNIFGLKMECMSVVYPYRTLDSAPNGWRVSGERRSEA